MRPAGGDGFRVRVRSGQVRSDQFRSVQVGVAASGPALQMLSPTGIRPSALPKRFSLLAPPTPPAPRTAADDGGGRWILKAGRFFPSI